MKHRFLFMPLALFSALLLFSGCFGGNGPSLFNNDEPEVVETPTDPNTPVAEEFGFRVEGTVCYKQLHSGCVPYDYYPNDSTVGLRFMAPRDWFISSASEFEVQVSPPDPENETDPTRLYVWRAVESPYAELATALKGTLVDAGLGRISDYDVKWEIYDSTWQGQDVKSEWVELTVDPDNPWVNFVFLMVTESDNFLKDQAVLKGAVSSLFMESEEESVEESAEEST